MKFSEDVLASLNLEPLKEKEPVNIEIVQNQKEQVNVGLLLFSDFPNHSASCYNVCVKGKIP